MLPPAGVTIRSGRADESAALAALIPGAGHEPYVSLPRLTACQAEGLLWTAVDGVDRPVGFLAATIADDALHIVALAVARAHQRRGVGRALLERAIDHGR